MRACVGRCGVRLRPLLPERRGSFPATHVTRHLRQLLQFFVSTFFHDSRIDSGCARRANRAFFALRTRKPIEPATSRVLLFRALRPSRHGVVLGTIAFSSAPLLAAHLRSRGVRAMRSPSASTPAPRRTRSRAAAVRRSRRCGPRVPAPALAAHQRVPADGRGARPEGARGAVRDARPARGDGRDVPRGIGIAAGAELQMADEGAT